MSFFKGLKTIMYIKGYQVSIQNRAIMKKEKMMISNMMFFSIISFHKVKQKSSDKMHLPPQD